MAIVSTNDVLLELGITSTASAEEVAVVIGAIKNAEGAVKRFLRYDPESGTHTQYLPLSNKQRRVTEQVWESYGSEAILREYGSGWSTELQVQHIPIRSITSLYVDYDGRSGSRAGSFAAETLKTAGSDYWANWDGPDSDGNSYCLDGILRSEGLWPEKPGCVRVTYTSGYSADELAGDDSVLNARPIFETVLTEAARRAKRTFMTQYTTGGGWVAGTLTGETLGDYSWRGGGTTSEDGTYTNLYDILASSREVLNDYINMGWPLNS